jgi:hypothetical protein
MERLMLANVVPFDAESEKIAAEIEREHSKRHRAFNVLWANYLRARADTIGAKGDRALDRACDARSDAMWAIIVAPAASWLQLDWKFELMRKIIEEASSDNRRTALLESIQKDVTWLANP